MKKLTIIGLLVVIVAVCLLLYRQHVESVARFDSEFRQQLAGVWLRAEDELPRGVGMALSMRCTNTVAADGSFVELSWFRHTDRTNTYQRTGTWLVNDGHLIETVKTSTNPTEVTPHSDAGRIENADTLGFAVRWQHSTNETIWQRVTK